MSLAAEAARVNAKIQILSFFALVTLQTCMTFFLALDKLMQPFDLQLNFMNSECIKLQKKSITDVETTLNIA